MCCVEPTGKQQERLALGHQLSPTAGCNKHLLEAAHHWITFCPGALSMAALSESRAGLRSRDQSSKLQVSVTWPS